ncbi:hypothetical protein ACA910_007901 [Epithemia clementina (nom. ined.)]
MASPQGSVSASGAASSIIGVMNMAKEKWDSSGASEAMGRMSASIPDSTKKYVDRLFKREHLRSVAVFFGIGEERSFYVEKTPSLLVERLRHNATFFYLNYLLLTAILFFLSVITSLKALIGMAILGLAWMWLIRATQTGSLKIGTIIVPQQTATIVMGVISIFVLFCLLSSIFWWALFTSGFFVAVHGFLRDASMHKDMEDMVAMEGDMNMGGEDAAFLNVASVDQV